MPVHLLDTAESFQKAVKQHPTIVVDFYAVWCGPCKVLAPFIEEYSNDERFKNVFFAKTDRSVLPAFAG